MPTAPTYDIALACFEQFQAEFPHLKMELNREPEDFDLLLDIPQQPGLLFDLHLNLQNADELHLVVGVDCWFSMFPCTKQDITQTYTESVRGLLTGSFRVVATYSKRRYLKSYLQKPENDRWKTVASSACGFALPFTHRRQVIFQNAATRPKPPSSESSVPSVAKQFFPPEASATQRKQWPSSSARICAICRQTRRCL